MRTLPQLALVLLSAALHAAAFPPWDLPLLAWVALAPLLVALDGQGPRRAWWLGALWGTAAHWCEAAWVLPAMRDYYQQPGWFAGLFGCVSSLLFRGLPYGLFAAAASWLTRSQRAPRRAATLAALWVAVEFLRARGPTEDPWLLMGYALSGSPLLLQGADLGGIPLLSFVIVFVNAALAACLRATPGRVAAAAIAVALLVGSGAYGLARMATPLPDAPAVPISIVQGNNDLGAQWRQEHYGAGLQTYLDLSRAAAARAHPRVLIWPESAVTFFLAREPRFLAPIQALLAETGAELITGAPHVEDPDPARPAFFNSAFTVTADGIAARYDKVRLLPFAEFFPLRFSDFLRRRFDHVRAFTPGRDDLLLDTRMGRVAVVICFEAVFAELVRARMNQGAEVLVNLSNDAWLGAGSGPAQHLAMVVPRAVENRTWVVRATTSGISAVIDPYGVVHDATPTFVTAVIDARIAPLRIETLYERCGDWFAWACVGWCGVAAMRRRRRVG